LLVSPVKLFGEKTTPTVNLHGLLSMIVFDYLPLFQYHLTHVQQNR